jgi:hypothetical protein
LLHAVRAISWRVWGIPFVATAVEHSTSDPFSLNEAFEGANLLLKPYNKNFLDTFKSKDV